MSLGDAQLERYARHIILKEIGGEGQRKLLEAQVVVVGAGGIGSPAIQYLAAAGVGLLTIIDDDRVELSNLQRQTLYGTDDVGQPKARLAKRKVAALNPDVAVDFSPARIDAANAPGLIEGADAVLDGSDNFATRLAVADAALALKVPLVSAAVGEFEGQLGVYRGWEPDKPCYRCLVGSDPDQPERSCADQGVLGAMAGLMGSLAAMETIRAITGFGEDSAGKLLCVDALTLRFRTVMLPKDPGCPSCGG
ncbi:MAG TPA: HesA/MoeB/ThiF family protein [Allosphingosinicella sp.]